MQSIISALPAWLVFLSLVVTALWGVTTVGAHIPGLPPKLTTVLARAGTFLGDVRKMLPPPPSDSGSSGGPTPPSTLRSLGVSVTLCALMGCTGTPPNPQHPVREEEVRGALYVMHFAVDAASSACGALSPSLPQAERCFQDVMAARAAEQPALDALEAWSHDQGSLKCALVAYAEPLIDIADALVDAGAPVPEAVKTGIYWTAVADKLEASSCPVVSADAGLQPHPIEEVLDVGSDAAHAESGG